MTDVLSDYASRLLDAAVGRLTARGCAVPARRYVSLGTPTPAVDGQTSAGLLTVHVARIYAGTPGHQNLAVTAVQQTVAEFTLTWLGCAPGLGEAGSFPDPTTLDQASRDGNLAGWAIQQVARDILADQSWQGPGTPAALGETVPVSADGYLWGWQTTLATAVVGMPDGTASP